MKLAIKVSITLLILSISTLTFATERYDASIHGGFPHAKVKAWIVKNPAPKPFNGGSMYNVYMGCRMSGNNIFVLKKTLTSATYNSFKAGYISEDEMYRDLCLKGVAVK